MFIFALFLLPVLLWGTSLAFTMVGESLNDADWPGAGLNACGLLTILGADAMAVYAGIRFFSWPMLIGFSVSTALLLFSAFPRSQPAFLTGTPLTRGPFARLWW